MDLFITNETSELESVILGISKDMGKAKAKEINPTMKKHIQENTYPTANSVHEEIRTFESVLIENGVKVFRPSNVQNKGQIFTRDIGFVIDDYFFIANMKHQSRRVEINGLTNILNEIDKSKIISIPENITIEGGNVVLFNDFIFLGIGDRTSKNAIKFFQNFFPKKNVIGFSLEADPNSIDKDILHLDCTFQPIGKDEALIYLNGFQQYPNLIMDIFSKDKLFEVTMEEKNLMFPNIFSISPSKIIIEKGFERLKVGLTKRGYEVLEVDYHEISKLGGLLRCSTLPLKRKKIKKLI